MESSYAGPIIDAQPGDNHSSKTDKTQENKSQCPKDNHYHFQTALTATKFS